MIVLHWVWLIYTPGDREALLLLLFLNPFRGDACVEVLNEDMLVAWASSGQLGCLFGLSEALVD